MIPGIKNNSNPWANHRRSTAETFWASYSDLMAGLLMIFALTTVMTLLDIGHRLVKPTEGVREWMQIVDAICNEKELQNIENVEVNPKTGALVISEKSLRFKFGETDLGEDAKNALRKAVPKYMEIIHRYPKFLDRIEMIEISGHTDRSDKNNANPWYSRERAGQVLSFLLTEPAMASYCGILKEKSVTSGYAATIFPESCNEDKCAEARRVEIAIRLNETDALIQFLEILKDVIS